MLLMTDKSNVDDRTSVAILNTQEYRHCQSEYKPRPRDATSVATKMGARPLRNSEEVETVVRNAQLA